MQWNEADLLVSPTATDLVALLVFECGSNGSVIDDEHPDHKGRIRITAYFPLAQEGLVETIREKMGALESRGVDLGDWKVVEKKADDKDWLFAWQEHFPPFLGGTGMGTGPAGGRRGRPLHQSGPGLWQRLPRYDVYVRPVPGRHGEARRYGL